MTLVPTQVTFRGLARSEALEAEIRSRVDWLEQFYNDIVRCHVLVERPHRHRHDGRHFHVRSEVTVPGGAPIIVSHEPSRHGGLKDFGAQAHHKDTETESVHRYAHVALREAFDAARRRLEDVAREQRSTVKTHEVPAHGEIVELAQAEGCGFIQAGERRVYFHRASVPQNAFDELNWHARGLCRGVRREGATGEHRARAGHTPLRVAVKTTAMGHAAPAAAERLPLQARHTVEHIDVARLFDRTADFLGSQGENPFRIHAYRTAARTNAARKVTAPTP